MPFDRLVRAVDEWAGAHPGRVVFAQIGDSSYTPQHIAWTPFLESADFRRQLFQSDLVVTHAGMGTILSALERARPVVVMPRRGHLRETRNDHQVATARAICQRERVEVAWDSDELSSCLDRHEGRAAPAQAPSHASLDLLTSLRDFIRGESSDAGARSNPHIRVNAR